MGGRSSTGRTQLGSLLLLSFDFLSLHAAVECVWQVAYSTDSLCINLLHTRRVHARNCLRNCLHHYLCRLASCSLCSCKSNTSCGSRASLQMSSSNFLQHCFKTLLVPVRSFLLALTLQIEHIVAFAPHSECRPPATEEEDGGIRRRGSDLFRRLPWQRCAVFVLWLDGHGFSRNDVLSQFKMSRFSTRHNMRQVTGKMSDFCEAVKRVYLAQKQFRNANVAMKELKLR